MPSPTIEEPGLAYTVFIRQRLHQFTQSNLISKPPTIEMTKALLEGRIIPAGLEPMNFKMIQSLTQDILSRLGKDWPLEVNEQHIQWFDEHILKYYTDDIIALSALKACLDNDLFREEVIRTSIFKGLCQFILKHTTDTVEQQKIKMCLLWGQHQQVEELQLEITNSFNSDLNWQIAQVEQQIRACIKHQPNQLQPIFSAIEQFDITVKKHEFFEQVTNAEQLINKAVAKMIGGIRDDVHIDARASLAVTYRYMMANDPQKTIMRAFHDLFSSVQSKDINELFAVFNGVIDGELQLDVTYHDSSFQNIRQIKHRVFESWEPYIHQVGTNLFSALLLNFYHEEIQDILNFHDIKTDVHFKLWLYDWTHQELLHPSLSGFTGFIKENHPEFFLDRTQYWLYLHSDHLLDLMLAETNGDLKRLFERVSEGDGRLLWEYPLCDEHHDITCINDFLSAPIVMETFQEKFQSFDISKGESSQEEFKSTFMRYFSEPLLNNPRWQKLLEQSHNMDEEQRQLLRRQVASAIVYKIQSQWWQANEPEHYKNKMVCLTTWIHAYPEMKITQAQNAKTVKFIDNQLMEFKRLLFPDAKQSFATDDSDMPLSLEEQFKKCLRTIRASTVFKASPNGEEILHAQIKGFLNQIHKEGNIKESRFIKVRTVVLADRRLSVDPEDLPKFSLKNPKESVRFFKGKKQKNPEDQKELYRTLSQHELQKSSTSSRKKHSPGISRKKHSPSAGRKVSQPQDDIIKNNPFNGV